MHSDSKVKCECQWENLLLAHIFEGKQEKCVAFTCFTILMIFFNGPIVLWDTGVTLIFKGSPRQVAHSSQEKMSGLTFIFKEFSIKSFCVHSTNVFLSYVNLPLKMQTNLNISLNIFQCCTAWQTLISLKLWNPHQYSVLYMWAINVGKTFLIKSI